MLRHAAHLSGCQVIITTQSQKDGIAALSRTLPAIYLLELDDARVISTEGSDLS